MNRHTQTYLLFLILAICFIGCRDDKCLHSTGDTYVENRPLTDSVTMVSVEGEFDVFLSSGSKPSLRIKAGRGVLPYIETTVKEGMLSIKDANQCEFFRDMGAPLEIYLTLPNLKELKFNSSGRVVSEGVLLWDTLRLNCQNGAGLIDVTYKSKAVYVLVHSGAEEVQLKGESTSLYCYVIGYGPLDATLAPCRFAHVVHLGSNKLKVAIEKGGTLTADIRYSGDVYYKGSPSDLSVIQTGSGELIKMK